MRPVLWLEDFNDQFETTAANAEQAGEAEFEHAPPPPDPRLEGWNEGFLAACRMFQANQEEAQEDPAAELMRRVAEIEAHLQETAQNAASLMAGFLLDLLKDALPDGFPEPASARLDKVIEAIRPVFELDPRLQLPGEPPGELSFRDLPAFHRALRDGFGAAAPLSLRWAAPVRPAEQLPALQAAIA
jgi:hypothetical protein